MAQKTLIINTSNSQTINSNIIVPSQYSIKCSNYLNGSGNAMAYAKSTTIAISSAITTYTFTIGSTKLDYLSTEEKQVALNKGWTLA